MICILRVIDGPATGTQCWLKQGQTITIGRLSRSDFSVTEDRQMSRNHLMVEGLPDGFRIRDVGSSNGTFVNDFPVTLVQICNGDQIRVGGSIFEVHLESSDSPPPNRAASRSEMQESFVPTRTLHAHSLAEMQHDEEVTMRLNATDLASAASPPSESIHSLKPIQGDPSWSREFWQLFSPGHVPWLFQQRSQACLRSQLRALDVLAASSSAMHASLIINTSQLGGAVGPLTTSLSHPSKACQLTETLSLFHSANLAEVLGLYRHCLMQDAAIFIASELPLPDAWLYQALDALSFPSMLFEMLSNSVERAEQLCSLPYGLLLEPDSSGHFCIAVNRANPD